MLGAPAPTLVCATQQGAWELGVTDTICCRIRRKRYVALHEYRTGLAGALQGLGEGTPSGEPAAHAGQRRRARRRRPPDRPADLPRQVAAADPEVTLQSSPIPFMVRALIG